MFLLVIAGLGGLLYGMDYGIVASALPYLKDTFAGTPAELSIIVAAMMLGGVFSTLFAGLLADWMGRKRLMNFCGVVFVAAIPLIALSHGYAPLFFGRLLEGISAGLIVPRIASASATSAISRLLVTGTMVTPDAVD